jgi:hypothetical protein
MRILAALILVVLGWTAPGSVPARLADTDVQPFIGSPGEPLSEIGTYGQLDVDQGSSAVLSYGVTGGSGTSDPTVTVSMTIPDYPGMSISPEMAGCVTQGLSEVCTGPLSRGSILGDARVSTTAATPLGYAGLVTVSTPGGADVSMPLWVMSTSQGADLEFLPTDAVARIGQTATVTVTVINHGPSPEPYWAIGDLQLPGAQLVGQHGCSPGVVRGILWQCAHRDFTPVGAAITVSFDITILAPQGGGALFSFASENYLNDPNPGNNNQSFTVAEYAGVSGPVSVPGPAARPDLTPPAAASPPTAAPSPTPGIAGATSGSATTGSATTGSGPAAAAQPGAGMRFGWWGLAAAALTVVALAAGAYVARNRARVARSPD